jgi:hypothetical protein
LLHFLERISKVATTGGSIDYHVITSEPIHRALAYLVEHLPPQVHLVIATHTDPSLPLARLRARGMMFEVRAAGFELEDTFSPIFFLGIPRAYKLALSLRPETRAELAHLGFSADFPASYIIILDTMTILAFALFAVLIFWRRSDDWMVMFVGLMLLLSALLYTAPASEANVPLALLALFAALAEISQVAFVYLFPDGRLVPRWTWILLLPLFVWRPAIWGFVYLPHFFSLQRSGENFYYVPQDTWDLTLLIALLAVGIIAQVYRYRHHSRYNAAFDMRRPS